jgi:lysophospholipase L1-like esterase
VIESYERYNDIAREVARETGALLIEHEGDIPGDPLHFTDTVHFTDLGSVAMARRIAGSLASSNELQALLRAAPGRERLDGTARNTPLSAR